LVVLPGHRKRAIAAHAHARRELLAIGYGVRGHLAETLGTRNREPAHEHLIKTVAVVVVLPAHDEVTVVGHADRGPRVLAGGVRVDGFLRKSVAGRTAEAALKDLEVT